MSIEFQDQLIESARQRLSHEMQQQFDRLDPEAQTDVAVTLMYCTDLLPPIFQPEDLDRLVAVVEEQLRLLTRQPRTVH